MVLVVARVLICLVRAFQFFEVAVVACKFERAVGFASGTFPHHSLPPSLSLITCNGRFCRRAVTQPGYWESELLKCDSRM